MLLSYVLVNMIQTRLFRRLAVSCHKIFSATVMILTYGTLLINNSLFESQQAHKTNYCYKHDTYAKRDLFQQETKSNFANFSSKVRTCASALKTNICIHNIVLPP